MKGKRQYDNFLAGKSLSPKQSILAMCYICNGESEGGEDCGGSSCPLYSYMPYNPTCRKTRKGRELSPEAKAKMKMGRERASRPS